MGKFWESNNDLCVTSTEFHFKNLKHSFSISNVPSLESAKEWVAQTQKSMYDFTAKYFPQILKVHMYITKKFALQANIFKISNVGIR